MQLIKLKTLLKIFRPEQMLEIFSVDNQRNSTETGIYTVSTIPNHFLEMYVGYLGPSTEQYINLKESDMSMLVLDIYDSLKDALAVNIYFKNKKEKKDE